MPSFAQRPSAEPPIHISRYANRATFERRYASGMADAHVLLCCLLWATPGQETGLRQYEDRVLALLPEHRGTVLQRAHSDGSDGRPNEVQLYWFEDHDAFQDYLDDPRRVALAEERDRVIDRADLFPVSLL